MNIDIPDHLVPEFMDVLEEGYMGYDETLLTQFGMDFIRDLIDDYRREHGYPEQKEPDK